VSQILVIDDDPHILRSLEIMLRSDGHEVWCATDAESALELLEAQPVDIALVDLQLPGMSGMEFLRCLRDRHRDVDAVIITAHASIETAVDAMKEGAFDYLAKPFSPDQVRHRIQQVERIRSLSSEVSGLRRQLGDRAEVGSFLTRTPATRHLLELARTVADSDATVLLTGESGTGKSLLARQIHDWSPRAGAPFVLVDCTSFHETLLESELFGHVRGAFTGAVSDKPGRIDGTGGGTLFLDEIGDTSPPVQAKLLRLVEDRTYEALGDPRSRTFDARIIAATNQEPLELVKAGRFREDLFYRLNVVELRLPTLRSRPADIPLLCERFLEELNRSHGRRVEGLDEEVERILVAHAWPGNVRELRHVLERAVLLCPGRTVRREYLPPRLLSSGATVPDERAIEPLAVVEEEALRSALAQGLPLEETARQLGIDPSTLWRKRKRLGL
jgi:NtrC-family two-component system response regulator AlgB